MYSPSSLPTVDELLAVIAEFVRENYQRTGRPTNGAFLAKSIHQRYGSDFHFGILADQGVSRLGDAIKMAEERRLVVRNNSVQHLEVMPPTGACECEPQSSILQFSGVRPDAWKAFVFTTQFDDIYINKDTGRMSRSSASSGQTAPALEESVWVKIDPISPQTQKDWTRDFVQQCLSTKEAAPSLDQERWWEVFSQWLREQDPNEDIEWRRYRTRKVIEHIREWAEEHEVPVEHLLVTKSRMPVARDMSTAANKVVSGDDAIRQAIMAAVQDMPLEELERISIPLRYVIRHFTAR